MAPRKDTSSYDEFPPSVTDQLAQLIAISTVASSSQTEIKTQLAALVQATGNLTTNLVNQMSDLSNSINDNLHPDPNRPNLERQQPPAHQNHRPPHHPKINLPMFDGTNPLGWIFQADNYFTYFAIPPADRVQLSAFHFVGDALSWYQHQQTNNLLGTWAEFKREQKLMNCYISGLKPDIRAELAVHKPTSYHDACGLARLLEDKLHQPTKPKPTYQFKPFTPAPSVNLPASQPFPKPPPPPTDKPASSSNPALLPTPPKPLPFTKLSPDAIQQRRREGLCFRCSEKYFPGHKCSPPQFLLIVDNDEFLTDQSDPTPDPQPPQFMSLSDAAFFGMSSIQTLRVTGYINGTPVTVLIDCGSTHNIIQPRIAANLHLDTKPLNPFVVMVGNGDFIHCQGHCPEVPIQLQKANFIIPFFIFPVQGADVVLGISWLRTLGSITADFSVPNISFVQNGSHTTLRGEPISRLVSPSSLSALIRHDSVASIHMLIMEPEPHDKKKPLPTSDPHITSILTTYQTKKIMTQLIEEMLKDGIIRPSQSPFSSPVLLVKKKDGTWCFCVDYRALNAATVRDRFLIPTIDELLDELHGSTIFSKIDLRSGYHQIRVAEPDIHKTAFRTSDGHYEFLVMPFGLTKAPSTFQSAMNDSFRSVLR
ncbi:uncharacterized protein LOC143583878 [Bidens hawaiensis]|uniref:uncharacterized protein LOC143583878 n=1 Tax=Bidens hawaiensis TaxID=980011 RepID=UPI0040492F0E